MSLTRRIVSTRFGQVHVRSKEGAGLPLILLHESPRAASMWQPMQELLDRPTHALDRLGYGYSDPPPWALSMEQYADSALDAMQALGIDTPFDLLGCQAGSLEAIEIAHRSATPARIVGLIGLPLYTADERAELLARYGDQSLHLAEDGAHLIGAWRNRFAYRKPPYDLAAAHARFTDFVLAPNAGASLRAVSGYDAEKRLKSMKSPIVLFAPRDELIEYTRRAEPLLSPNSVYVDLHDLTVDCCETEAPRMADLIRKHLPL